MGGRVPVDCRSLREVRGRALAYVVLAAVLVALLGPPLWPPAEDSYPLSTYPMFSRDRGRTSVVATVVGRDGDGGEHRLSPGLIGGADEPMLAVATAARAVDEGPPGARRLCQQVAERVAASDRGHVVEVVVQVERHDPVAHFVDDAPAAQVDVLTSCPVVR